MWIKTPNGKLLQLENVTVLEKVPVCSEVYGIISGYSIKADGNEIAHYSAIAGDTIIAHHIFNKLAEKLGAVNCDEVFKVREGEEIKDVD